MLAAENIEETIPLPEDFTGDGQLFMLRVRGDSMIDAGIFDGDFVVVRQQDTAENGDIVVAGIPGERGHGQDVPAQARQDRAAAREPGASTTWSSTRREVTIYGKVVTVLRRL